MRRDEPESAIRLTNDGVVGQRFQQGCFRLIADVAVSCHADKKMTVRTAVGLLDAFRRKDVGDCAPIYLFTIKVASGETEIPSPMIGARVVGYALGEEPTGAAERAVNELRAMGYAVTDMKPSGGQLAASDWDKHVAERWPEFTGHFPTQDDIMSVLARDNAIFGPFAGFEQQG